MSHNNYTLNNNNTYTVEIATDPSSAGGPGTTTSYDADGNVYYKMDIFPTAFGTPLFAGNFTIDGISPTYKWSWNANPIGPDNQSAPVPPHSYYTTQQIQKTLIGQYGPTYPLDNNPIYGPIKFDPFADNFNGQVHFDDGSCTYPSPRYSITFNGPSGNATGPYTNAFTNSTFANLNPNDIRNFIFNGGVPLVLNNTYAAGDLVSELVTINLTPVTPNVIPTFEAVYDFPNPGGPNANLDNTDPDIGFGDSTNNLTAASIRFLNLDNYDSSSQTPNYLSTGNSLYTQPDWVADGWVDSTGATPSTIVSFDFQNGIDTFDDNGDPINLDTDTIQIEEFYFLNTNAQLNTNPGYEWYPYKLTISILFDFTMPAHDLNIVLDLDHNTENQGGNI